MSTRRGDRVTRRTEEWRPLNAITSQRPHSIKLLDRDIRQLSQISEITLSHLLTFDFANSFGILLN